MNAFSPYSASLTSDQFLFHEMRITARLLSEGAADEEVISAIVRDNLFSILPKNPCGSWPAAASDGCIPWMT